MKITLESTDKTVTLNGVPARIWEGKSEQGVPVICFITSIAVREDAGPEAHRMFASELQEHRAPSAEAQAFPLRMIL